MEEYYWYLSKGREGGSQSVKWVRGGQGRVIEKLHSWKNREKDRKRERNLDDEMNIYIERNIYTDIQKDREIES